MIEIYLLEQLVAFETYGTLSGAAGHLNISQPALSRSMQKLESLMGVPLFERQKNKIVLTESGRLTVSYAKRILQTEKEMMEQVQTSYQMNHTISIGSVAPGPNMYFTPILSEIYPDMNIISELQEENALLDGLKKDKYQIIFLHHDMEEKGLFCSEAAMEKLYLAVLPAHPAASLKEVSFSDMDGENFLMYTHVGIWDDIVRTHMPNSRFLLQYEYEDFGEIVRTTSLPCFGTNLAARMDAPVSNTGERIGIPFSDDAATISFYAICKAKNRKRYHAFFQKLPAENT